MFLNKLVLIVVLWGAYASACEKSVWSVEGQMREICFDENLNAVFSADCFQATCEAMTLVKKSRSIHLDKSNIDSSRNPGSAYCKVLHGVVVLGRNERGSQIAFCQAADKSIVDLLALAKK
jgi:putative hemolysin